MNSKIFIQFVIHPFSSELFSDRLFGVLPCEFVVQYLVKNSSGHLSRFLGLFPLRVLLIQQMLQILIHHSLSEIGSLLLPSSKETAIPNLQSTSLSELVKFCQAESLDESGVLFSLLQGVTTLHCLYSNVIHFIYLAQNQICFFIGIHSIFTISL